MTTLIQRLIVISAFVTFAIAQIDQTLEPLAAGKDVVDAVLKKIRKSGIFSDDYEFLRRIAWVETHYGERNETFAPNWFGGIWNVPQIFLDRTKEPVLAAQHADIQDVFSVDWGTVTWNNLTIPLHSGIASRLYLSWLELVRNQSIPEKRQDQANLWNLEYNRKDEYNDQTFINETEGMENATVPCSGKMDFVMVLDGSGSITEPNFELCKSFIVDLMNSFNLRGTRLGMILYSSEIFPIFELDNYMTMEELSFLVENMTYPNARTDTNAAILAAISYFEDAEPRYGVPKIMAVFTDGASTSPGVSNAAIAQEAGIISYAVGITELINQDELNEIAYNISQNVYLINGFDALEELYRRLNQDACTIPQKPPLDESTDDVCVAGETRYFGFDVPEEGITIFNAALIGAVGGYYSYTEENPSSAIHDGQLKPNGVFIPQLNVTRASKADTPPTVYVAITGLEPYNEYTIKAATGNMAGPDPDTTTTEATTTTSPDPTTQTPITTTLGASTLQITMTLLIAALSFSVLLQM